MANRSCNEASNVVATRGTIGDDGTHRVLNTHIDTVPPHVPYERNGDVLRGRGTCDAKGSLVAMLDAFFSASTGDPMLAPTRAKGEGPFNQIPSERTVRFDRHTVPQKPSTTSSLVF